MSTPNLNGRGAGSPSSPADPAAPAASVPIKAIRLRHPWRMVFAIVLIAAFVLFVIDAAFRPAYDWPTVAKYLFDRRISQAALVTL